MGFIIYVKLKFVKNGIKAGGQKWKYSPVNFLYHKMM